MRCLLFKTAQHARTVRPAYHRRRATGHSRSPSQKHDFMKLVIVDDIAANRKLLRVTLEAEGHTAFEAADGVEALQLLAREKVDAVVSDILMPRMDGYRLCHEIRT